MAPGIFTSLRRALTTSTKKDERPYERRKWPFRRGRPRSETEADDDLRMPREPGPLLQRGRQEQAHFLVAADEGLGLQRYGTQRESMDTATTGTRTRTPSDVHRTRTRTNSDMHGPPRGMSPAPVLPVPFSARHRTGSRARSASEAHAERRLHEMLAGPRPSTRQGDRDKPLPPMPLAPVKHRERDPPPVIPRFSDASTSLSDTSSSSSSSKRESSHMDASADAHADKSGSSPHLHASTPELRASETAVSSPSLRRTGLYNAVYGSSASWADDAASTRAVFAPQRRTRWSFTALPSGEEALEAPVMMMMERSRQSEARSMLDGEEAKDVEEEGHQAAEAQTQTSEGEQYIVLPLRQIRDRLGSVYDDMSLGVMKTQFWLAQGHNIQQDPVPEQDATPSSSPRMRNDVPEDLTNASTREDIPEDSTLAERGPHDLFQDPTVKDAPAPVLDKAPLPIYIELLVLGVFYPESALRMYAHAHPESALLTYALVHPHSSLLSPDAHEQLPASAFAHRREWAVRAFVACGALGSVHVAQHRSGALHALKCTQFAGALMSGAHAEAVVRELKVLQMLRRAPGPFLAAPPKGVERWFWATFRSQLCFVTPYCPGGDLDALRGELDEHTVMLVAAELILAIEHLHAQGIVHNDVTPANILIDGAGHVVLSDFNSAALVAEGLVRTRGKHLGAREFRAPEMQDAGARPGAYTPTVDWWSLGVCVLVLVAGVTLARTRRESMPPELERSANFEVDQQRMDAHIVAQLAKNMHVPPPSWTLVGFLSAMLQLDPDLRGLDLTEHKFFEEITSTSSWAAVRNRQHPPFSTLPHRPVQHLPGYQRPQDARWRAMYGGAGGVPLWRLFERERMAVVCAERFDPAEGEQPR